MALTKKNKRILYVMLGMVIVIGILLIFIPNTNLNLTPDQRKKLEYSGESVLVIKPRLTEAAYSDGGFYDYYSGKCGKECLTIPVNSPGRADKWGAYNARTVQVLSALGYPIMDDSALHWELMKNPKYLDQYGTVILLHSEYVTPELYKAITHHRNVIYLAPNSLYAMVLINREKVNGITSIDTMTLANGHGYPTQDISNGFGWKNDNTPEEYDTECHLWSFHHIDNGYQLNCAPTMLNPNKINILIKMKDFIQ
jgi:hypothetical protein